MKSSVYRLRLSDFYFKVKITILRFSSKLFKLIYLLMHKNHGTKILL